MRTDKQPRKDQIKSMIYRSSQPLTASQIGARLGIKGGHIHTMLKELVTAGEITRARCEGLSIRTNQTNEWEYSKTS